MLKNYVVHAEKRGSMHLSKRQGHLNVASLTPEANPSPF